MAKTYLELTNIALRDINEVPISSSQFASPRGLQASAKEMINRAYADILNYSKEWPFLNETTSALVSVTTTEMQQEYDLDTGLANVDWDSFFASGLDGEYNAPLIPVDIDYYTRYMKVDDLRDEDGQPPRYVFRLKSNQGFGLSPFPDDTGYTITYAGWKHPTLLVDALDEVVIPDRYYNVIIARARYYLWMYRENTQQASFALNEYDKNIKQMHRDLVEKQSTRMRAV